MMGNGQAGVDQQRMLGGVLGEAWSMLPLGEIAS